MKGDIPVDLYETWVDEPTAKPGLYLYPITPYCFKPGANDYILKVKEMLNEDFDVVNSVTSLGMVDILLKLHKCRVVFFNWICDLPDKRFGYLQIPMLIFILVLCKIFRIRIAWFVHNDGSHFRKNERAKKFIRNLMIRFCDIAFSHSGELSIKDKLKNLEVFEHPVDEMKESEAPASYPIDMLIWGSVSEYKGVGEFVRFNHETKKLDDYNIRVAGRFSSQEFFDEVSQYAKSNITLVNRVHSDEELEDLFRQSRFIVFCYTSSSVLSSAALCKSLSYGKTVIGPNIGSFKELGQKGLIYTYNSFDEMADLVVKLKEQDAQVDKQTIRDYIHATSWSGFKYFLSEHLSTADADPAIPAAAVAS